MIVMKIVVMLVFVVMSISVVVLCALACYRCNVFNVVGFAILNIICCNLVGALKFAFRVCRMS